LSFFDGFMCPEPHDDGGVAVGGGVPVVPVSVGGGSGFYYATPRIRTAQDLSLDERPKVEILDPMNMPLKDVLSLLQDMRIKGVTIDDLYRRLGTLPRREIVADPYTNLKIALNSLPRRQKERVEDDLRRTVREIMQHQTPRPRPESDDLKASVSKWLRSDRPRERAEDSLRRAVDEYNRRRRGRNN